MFVKAFFLLIIVVITLIAICLGAPNTKPHNHHLKINGVDAKIEDFPWVASIQHCASKCVHICDAIIINENWVLTGSNCIEYIPAQKVVAGTMNLDQDDKVTVDIESFSIHPNAPDEGEGPKDLALFKLSQPLTFNEKVQPAKLPKQGQEFTGKANVTGFGNTDLPGFNGLQADLGTTIISNDECKAAMKTFPGMAEVFDDDSNVCTLSKTETTCNGDIGGSVSQDGTVIGAVGWYLDTCGNIGAPNVFNKLSYFAEWIEETVSENN